MKKLIGFIMALVFAVLLTSCDDEITHQDVFDSISIISSENKNSITEDFSFQYEVIDSVVIIFESNNEEVIKIIDNEAIVNRPNVDTTVNVEVKISIDNKTKDFSIEFTVLKQVILDKTPPVITGAKDFIYTIGDAAPKDEIHNLKPSDVGINSSRGNYPFVNGSGSYGRVGNGWYPGDEDRGDIARIIFYMVTYYTDLKISTMGSANVFKEWHILDPVDDFERNRNDVIYGYTNNRNPYIDHPHFVDLINW